LLGGEPHSARHAEVTRGGRQRDWGSAVLYESSDLVGGTQIRLVDDAGLALDPGAFDHIIVELVALLLGNERSHIG
jgi:hypothetical protein